MKKFLNSTSMPVLLAALVIGLSIALLYHFACIWVYGKFYIQEPNIAILVIESLVFIAILGFGIVGLVNSANGLKKE